MNRNRLQTLFNSFGKKAKQLIKDKDQTLGKLQEGLKKATTNKGALTEIWEQLQLLFALAKDYANGSYTHVSKRSIMVVIAGLLYFISPIDLIPDFIAGLGFVDDIYILTLVYKQIAKDLEKYQLWKDRQRTTIHI
ncbi:YkvA family protein [Pedobacter sp. UC225_65]|uniref:YkvA family protein n=1 Tax=Pedobacter sp. UC225_65 TaxID=3350173 RepID=UPI00366E8B3B